MAKRDVQRRIDTTSAFAAATYVVSASGGTAVHGLNSAYHTGSLGDAQAPQFLLLTGTRAMLGNLDMGGMSVTNVNLVDGEDVSQHGVRLGVLEGRRVHAGAGMTGTTTDLGTGDITLNVIAATPSGLDVQADSVAIADSIAGNGLDIANKILSVRTARGLEIVSDDVRVDEDFAFLWTAAHRWQLSAVDTVVISPAYKTLSVNWGNPNGTFNSAIRAQAGAVTDRTLYLKQIAAQTGEILRVENVAGDALINLTHEGDLESGNPGFVSGLTGWQIAHTGDAEFNNIVARGELHASIFSADELHAQGGTMTLLTATKVAPPNVATDNVLGALNAGFTLVVQASYDTGFCYFAQNDIIRAKFMGPVDAGQALDLWDIFLTVSGAPVYNNDRDMVNGNPGTHDVPVVLRMGGSTGLDIPAGTAIVKWGKVGGAGGSFTGGLLLTTDLAQAPYIDVYTVAADKAVAAWGGVAPTIKPRVRVGNLDGVLGLSEQWGMAAGTDLSDTSDDARYLVASDTQFKLHNIDLDMWSSAARRVYMTAAGNVQFGTNTSFAASTTFDFTASTGALRIGPGSGGAHINWTGTNLEVRNSADAAVITLSANGNSYFSGVMTIATSGEIRQGTVTAGNIWDAWPLTNFTGLRIWNASSIGRIGGYNLNTVQWEADSTGRLLFGGGAGLLGQYGLNMDYVTTASVPVPTHTLSGINWWADATAANPASQMPNVRAYGYKITGTSRYGFQVDVSPATGPAMYLEDGGATQRFFALSNVDTVLFPGSSFTNATATLPAVSHAGHVIPQSTNTYNLGAPTFKYANIYASNVIADSITGSVPLSGQTWQYDSGNMYIKSNAAAARTLYIQNDNASYTLSVVIEGNLTVNGTITGSSGSDHPAVSIGAGGDSALLSINPSTQVLTLADITTAAVSESGNLYYTDARARAAVSGSSGISYNSGTGVFTLDAAVAGAGLAISGGVMSVGVSGLGLSTDVNNVILTSSSDVSAGTSAILASLNGTLTLKQLSVNLGTFSVGTWINTAITSTPGTSTSGSMAINKAVDTQFALDIAGAARATWWIGPHAIQLKDVLFLAHFDGRQPFATNYTGEPNGHMGQVGTPVGDLIYRPGMFGTKAIQCAGPTLNLLPNPSAESNTTGYGTGRVGATITRVPDAAYIGNYGIQRTSGTSGSQNLYYNGAAALGGGNTYTFSAYLRSAAGDDISNSGIQMYMDSNAGGQVPTAIVSVGDGWYRFILTRTAASWADAVVGFMNLPPTVWYTDGWQLEQKSYATPYHDSTLSVSTPNMTRVASGISYPTSGNLQRSAGTIMAWIWVDGDTGADQYIFRANADSGTEYVIMRRASNGALVCYWGASARYSVATIPVRSWTHVALTYAGGNLSIYVNGVTNGLQSAGTAIASLNPTMYVGRSSTDTAHLNGYIDDLAITSSAMDAGAILAVYESKAPVFAESSTYVFRATPKGLVYGDDNGFWIKDTTGAEVFGVSAGVGSVSWGGQTLAPGDILMGRGDDYILWDDVADSGTGKLTIAGDMVLQGGTVGLKRYGHAALPSIFAGAPGTTDAEVNQSAFRVYSSGDVFLKWIYGGSDGKLSLRPAGSTTFYVDLLNSHAIYGGANFKYAWLNVGYELTTEAATVSIGGYSGYSGRAGTSQVRFITSTSGIQTTITRYAGLNGAFAISNTGTGDMIISQSSTGKISLELGGVERAYWDQYGKLRLGSSETGVAKIAPHTSFTLNNSATYNFTTWPVGLVLITVYDVGNASYEAGLFLARGADGSVSLINGGGTMTDVRDTNANINFYFYNNAYTIQNRRGGSRNISVTIIGHPLGI